MKNKFSPLKNRNKISLMHRMFLIISSVLIVIPIVFTVTASFMSNGELNFYYSDGGKGYVHLLPDFLSFENYKQIFITSTQYLQKFWISIGLCLTIVSGQVVISCLAGYAFIRYEFKFKKIIFTAVVVFMLLPLQATIVSHYILMEKLNLINTYWSIILPLWFSPFGVFLMRQFFSTIPNSLTEAARLDGASEFTIFLKIALPQRKNGVVSLMVLAFVDSWNMVEQPLVFLEDTYKYPLSTLTSSLKENGMGIVFACGVLALIPTLLLFLNYQDALVEGISTSEVRKI